VFGYGAWPSVNRLWSSVFWKSVFEVVLWSSTFWRSSSDVRLWSSTLGVWL